MSGRVIPAVTDHGPGDSGPFCSWLLAFPKVAICGPMEADSIPMGACTGALAPALGCALHPSSPGVPVLRVWPRSCSKPKFSHSKPFSHPAQVGHAGFSLFLKGWVLFLLTGDATRFVCWTVSAKPRAKASFPGWGTRGATGTAANPDCWGCPRSPEVNLSVVQPCVCASVCGLRAQGCVERGARGCYRRGWKEPAFLQPVYQYLVDGLSSPSPPPFFL